MIITRVIDFPDCSVKAMVIQDANGDDNIYINSRLSIEQQREGYLHELSHIKGNDFEKADVQRIETEVRSANRSKG